MTFENVTQERLPEIAAQIIQILKDQPVACFYGDLGAGKTTLIKVICGQLQVTDNVSSPTFPIINEYRYADGILYHIDLYRLKSVDEALSIGLDEYLNSGNPCFIEWPDRFESLMPGDFIKIFIRNLGGNTRTIEIVSSKAS